MNRHLTLAAAVAAVVAIPALAADRNERVQFARGATSKALAGSVRGYDSVNYIVGARAGQTLSVNFRSPNTAAYMNVWAPGSDEAIFIGSNEGNRFSGTLSVSGDYRVQVYLYRNAARRGERANYNLTVGVR
jgi:hypothetical protein